MDAEQVRRELWKQLNPCNESMLGNMFLAPTTVMTDFVNKSAEAIAKMADESKPEPPEPPKTVLPDVSDLEPGDERWFFAEDGEQVRCWCDPYGDWQWSIGRGWQDPDDFVLQHPHLGRLREAVPGEVAE